MSTTYQDKHRHHVGGGEIGAVSGLSTYRTPQEVAEEKLGLRDEPELESYHIKRGNYLESGCVEWAQDLIGEEVVAGDFSKGINLKGVSGPIDIDDVFRATPDSSVDLLTESTGEWTTIAAHEHKCPSPEAAFRKWGPHGSGQEGVPEDVIPQATVEAKALGVDLTYVSALIGGNIRLYRVPFNPELYEVLKAIAERFLEYIGNGEVPPMGFPNGGQGYSGAAAEWLKRKFPEARGREDWAEITDSDEEQIIYQYAAADQLFKKMKKDREAKANLVKEWLGDRSGVLCDAGKIYWRNNKGGTKTDWEAMARELGATDQDIQKFTRQTKGARPFKAYWNK